MSSAIQKKYPRRYSFVDAIILHRLMEGEIHKMRELAELAEVSVCTVQRSIERLSPRFIIHTFKAVMRKAEFIWTKDIYILA